MKYQGEVDQHFLAWVQCHMADRLKAFPRQKGPGSGSGSGYRWELDGEQMSQQTARVRIYEAIEEDLPKDLYRALIRFGNSAQGHGLMNQLRERLLLDGVHSK